MQQIINYLLGLIFKKQKKSDTTETKPSQKEEYMGMLSFYLTEDTDIDVQYALPKVDNLDSKLIPELAEKYASFLMAINDGYLRDHIIQMVEDNLKKNFNPNEVLFWDNVITSWAVQHVEAQQKKTKQKKDQPLIRPLSVFNSTGL